MWRAPGPVVRMVLAPGSEDRVYAVTIRAEDRSRYRLGREAVSVVRRKSQHPLYTAEESLHLPVMTGEQETDEESDRPRTHKGSSGEPVSSLYELVLSRDGGSSGSPQAEASLLLSGTGYCTGLDGGLVGLESKKGSDQLGYVPMLAMALRRSLYIWRSGSKVLVRHRHSKALTTVTVDTVGGNVYTGEADGKIIRWLCLGSDLKLLKDVEAGDATALQQVRMKGPKFQPQAEGVEEGKEGGGNRVSDRKVSVGESAALVPAARGVHTAVMHWHSHAVSATAISADGSYLISGGEEAVLVIWQLRTGHKGFLPRLGAPISSLAVFGGTTDSNLGPGGEAYAVGLLDSSLILVDSGARSPMWRIRGFSLHGLPRWARGLNRGLVLHPATGQLIVEGVPGSGTLQMVNFEDRSVVQDVEVTPRNLISRVDDRAPPLLRITHAAVSRDGKHMATVEVLLQRPEALWKGSAHVRRQKFLKKNIKTDDSEAARGRRRSRGNSVSAPGGAEGGQVPGAGKGRAPPVVDVEKEGLGIDTSDESPDAVLKFWNWNSADRRWNLVTRCDTPHKGMIKAVEFHPWRALAVTCSTDRTFKVWEEGATPAMAAAPSGDKKPKQQTSEKVWTCRSVGFYKDLPASAATFSGDGSLLAMAYGTSITLWSPLTNLLRSVLSVSTSTKLSARAGYTPKSLTFLGDSPYLVSLSPELLCLWDVLTGQLLWSYRGYMGALTVAPSSASSISDQSSSMHFAVTAANEPPRRQGLMNPLSTDSVKRFRFVLVFSPKSCVPVFIWDLGQDTGADALTWEGDGLNGSLLLLTQVNRLLRLRFDAGAAEAGDLAPGRRGDQKMSESKDVLMERARSEWEAAFGESNSGKKEEEAIAIRTALSGGFTGAAKGAFGATLKGPTHSLPDVEALFSLFLKSREDEVMEVGEEVEGSRSGKGGGGPQSTASQAVSGTTEVAPGLSSLWNTKGKKKRRAMSTFPTVFRVGDVQPSDVAFFSSFDLPVRATTPTASHVQRSKQASSASNGPVLATPNGKRQRVGSRSGTSPARTSSTNGTPKTPKAGSARKKSPSNAKAAGSRMQTPKQKQQSSRANTPEVRSKTPSQSAPQTPKTMAKGEKDEFKSTPSSSAVATPGSRRQRSRRKSSFGSVAETNGEEKATPPASHTESGVTDGALADGDVGTPVSPAPQSKGKKSTPRSQRRKSRGSETKATPETPGTGEKKKVKTPPSSSIAKRTRSRVATE